MSVIVSFYSYFWSGTRGVQWVTVWPAPSMARVRCPQLCASRVSKFCLFQQQASSGYSHNAKSLCTVWGCVTCYRLASHPGSPLPHALLFLAQAHRDSILDKLPRKMLEHYFLGLIMFWMLQCLECYLHQWSGALLCSAIWYTAPIILVVKSKRERPRFLDVFMQIICCK